MNELITATSTGLAAFTATNLDDIMILLVFFSQVSPTFRPQQIVTGQYLGFTALVLASLPSFFGGQFFPEAWVGLLGTFPIMMGINQWLNADEEAEEDLNETPEPGKFSHLAGLFSPQACGVAAVTVANGSDNLSIYVPLFASSTGESLAVILVAFFSLVSVWCYTAYRLTQLPAFAQLLTRYGNYLMPFILMGLGIFILIDNHTLENRWLSILAAGIISFYLFRVNRTKAWI
jgi:cadmium resistance transport/sequestration family protein